jgi:hypothetical protein
MNRKRTPKQLRKMWAMLADIAKTHPWAEWLDKDDWKIFFADSSTSNLTVEEMSELLTRMRTWANRNGVKFSDEQGLTWGKTDGRAKQKSGIG